MERPDQRARRLSQEVMGPSKKSPTKRAVGNQG